MALITIDGTAMPSPNQYSIPMEDMDSSDTSYSESGVYIRNRVRQGICKINLGWMAGGSDAAVLLKAIEPDKVRVNYYDPRKGAFSEDDMYVEGRSCSLVKYESDDDPDANLWEITFSLVQY